MNQHEKQRREARLSPRIAAAIVGALLFGVYAGAYVVRSLDGRFEPAHIGLNGVKWYQWAPAGFVTDFKWNHAQLKFYYPLYLLDIRFWHNEDAEFVSKYPFNEVKPEEIWKVYKAWR